MFFHHNSQYLYSFNPSLKTTDNVVFEAAGCNCEDIRLNRLIFWYELFVYFILYFQINIPSADKFGLVDLDKVGPLTKWKIHDTSTTLIFTTGFTYVLYYIYYKSHRNNIEYLQLMITRTQLSLPFFKVHRNSLTSKLLAPVTSWSLEIT